MSEPNVIYSATYWPTNAHMIADCARLGYLRSHWLTLDPTYGLGNFWTIWQPTHLVAGDLFTKADMRIDFTALPFRNQRFNAVVYDPPYKLNGTPSAADIAYGVNVPTRWQDRIKLIIAGAIDCARVVKCDGYLLIKCQDQVVSGRKVWQTDIISRSMANCGMTKVDRLDFLTNPRPQPHTRQLHARQNYSTMLVFQKRG